MGEVISGKKQKKVPRSSGGRVNRWTSTVSTRREARAFWVFISPWLIGFVCLTLGPMMYSLYASFTNWNGIRAPEFIGAANFIKMFTGDDKFVTSLINTAIYTVVSVPINLSVALVLAVLLNCPFRGKTLFRALLYLPSVCAGVAIFIVWTNLFNPYQGFFNYILAVFGINGPDWLQSPQWAMPALIVMNVTFCGSTMLIFLAGLQNVPEMLYEAARVDGANLFHMFFRITLPMISPVIFYNLIMSMIGALQIFTQPMVMTEGGPIDATYVYGLHLYNNAFRYYDFGYACALSWVLFVIIMVLSLGVIRSSDSWVYSEGRQP
ncbi:MAG: sugar ABC transporter permease [Eubacteriales bacterium]|nr:sugar ABC transporter permease [Eubacteriales bacterium]